jgi:hypothetical protein
MRGRRERDARGHGEHDDGDGEATEAAEEVGHGLALWSRG